MASASPAARRARAAATALLLVASGPLAPSAFARDPADAGALKALSLEELFIMEVTSVSREPESLALTASAIQVITGDEIRRSGATSLPEALRLATNLEVARVNAHDWAITARGFNGAPLSNNSLANKLLVLVDGRSVYTPLFAGVFWDVQNVLLADVDRIEVISGPGATVWGANAVNGVINVVTKSAADTQGLHAEAAAGTHLLSSAAIRAGSRAESGVVVRAYALRREHGSTELPGPMDANDRWEIAQGGFRLDRPASPGRVAFTLQGDAYRGREGDPLTAIVEGQNLLARWSRATGPDTEFLAKVWLDRTWRDLPEQDFHDEMRTLDAEVQHRFPIGRRHGVVWGVGYRLAHDDVRNTAPLSFDPEDRTLHVVHAFVQDAVSLAGGAVRVTAGSKIGTNSYSGVEIQPGVRAAWSPHRDHTLWAAAARAVRTPSRFDTDLRTPGLSGDSDFEAERVHALEAGYRVRLLARALLSVAGFENRYGDIRSANHDLDGPSPFAFRNDFSATTRGVEVSLTCDPAPWWRVRAGYTRLHDRFTAQDPGVYPGSETFEALDPSYRVQFHSSLDLPGGVEVDALGRYVDELPAGLISAAVPGYFVADIRVARRFGPVEASVAGRDLGEKRHREFGTVIPREFRGQLTCRL